MTVKYCESIYDEARRTLERQRIPNGLNPPEPKRVLNAIVRQAWW